MGAALPLVTAHGAGHVPRGGGLAHDGEEGMKHFMRRTAGLLALTGWLLAHHAGFATAPVPPDPHEGSPHAVESTPTLPNLADRSGWPSPVDDTAMYSFVLFDVLEYQRTSDLDALRWDILGWLGGDYNRFWFKSEGRKVLTSREGSEVEAQ